MKPLEVRRSIDESMRSGAARVLDDSRTLSPDPKKHSDLLAQYAVQAQDDPACEAWDVVVQCMGRLVYRIAELYFWKWSSHLPSHASFDDVFMAGLEGLVVAVGKFDPTKGSLSTIATPWIRTRVQRSIYIQCGSARIPEHLLVKMNTPQTAPFVAAHTESLDQPAHDDQKDVSIAMTLEAPPTARPDYESQELDALDKIVRLLRSVDEKMPQIAELLDQGYADRDVARAVGITATGVASLRKKAAAALREAGYR